MLIAVFARPVCACTGEAGFRTPELLVRNVYAYYGNGAPDLSRGLPRDEATAQKFFDSEPAQRLARAAYRAL